MVRAMERRSSRNAAGSLPLSVAEFSRAVRAALEAMRKPSMTLRGEQGQQAEGKDIWRVTHV